jgi:hypothetical protein
VATITAAILAWFGKEGVGLLLGALGKLALDAFNSWQANKAQRDLGRAEAELGQAGKTIDAQAAELEAQANAPRDEDEAIARLEDGSA